MHSQDGKARERAAGTPFAAHVPWRAVATPQLLNIVSRSCSDAACATTTSRHPPNTAPPSLRSRRNTLLISETFCHAPANFGHCDPKLPVPNTRSALLDASYRPDHIVQSEKSEKEVRGHSDKTSASWPRVRFDVYPVVWQMENLKNASFSRVDTVSTREAHPRGKGCRTKEVPAPSAGISTPARFGVTMTPPPDETADGRVASLVASHF